MIVLAYLFVVNTIFHFYFLQDLKKNMLTEKILVLTTIFVGCLAPWVEGKELSFIIICLIECR